MNQPKTHTSSGAVVYRKNGSAVEILVMYRKRTDSWHLPKGSQQAGESLEATALREIKEETGYSVLLGAHLGTLPSTFVREGATIEKTTHYFLATPASHTPSHDQEHDLVCFKNFNEALNLLERLSVHEKEGEMLRLAGRTLGLPAPKN